MRTVSFRRMCRVFITSSDTSISLPQLRSRLLNTCGDWRAWLASRSFCPQAGLQAKNMDSGGILGSRLAVKKELRALRLKWREEFLKKREEKSQQNLSTRARVLNTQRDRKEKQAAHKEELAAAGQQIAWTHLALEGERKAQASQWSSEVIQIYRGIRSRRKNLLLKQSRTWIRPEDVDHRIQQALAQPIEMA